jgi:hypothetical protein
VEYYVKIKIKTKLDFLIFKKMREIKRSEMMEGIKYVVAESGEKTAVQIDLTKYGELWEDFYDILVSKERENEQTFSMDEVKDILKNDNLEI